MNRSLSGAVRNMKRRVNPDSEAESKADGYNDAIQRYNDAIRRYGGLDDVTVAMHFLSSVETLYLQHHFVTSNVCELVCQALASFGTGHSNFAEKACLIIANLSENDENIDLLASLGACEAINTALGRWGNEHVGVAENGFKAISSLTTAYDGSDNFGTRFGLLGTCELVCRILRHWVDHGAGAAHGAAPGAAHEATARGGDQVGVVEQGCKAVYRLSADENDNIRLGEAGACGIVCDALIRWGSTNVGVAEQGCNAVSGLSSRNDNNIALLVQSEACTAVCRTLTHWGSVHAGVAKAGLTSVIKMFGVVPNPDLATLMGAAGACEAVCSVMTRWASEHEDVAKQGCRAISKLSLDSPENKNRLGSAGACRVIRAFLTRWGLSSVQCAEFGCKAVVDLSSNHVANKNRLFQEGACEAVCAVLDRRGLECNTVAEEGCMAISIFTSPETPTEIPIEIQSRLGQAGACKILINILRRWRHDFEVVNNACSAVIKLSLNHNRNKDYFSAEYAHEYMTRMSILWPQIEIVQQAAIALIPIHQLGADGP